MIDRWPMTAAIEAILMARAYAIEAVLMRLGPACIGGRAYLLEEHLHGDGGSSTTIVGEPDDTRYAVVTVQRDGFRFSVSTEWLTEPP